MIFGKTHDQKKEEDKLFLWDNYLGDVWFAWYPVKLDDGRWAWLSLVWKRNFIYTNSSDIFGNAGITFYDMNEFLSSGVLEGRIRYVMKHAPEEAKEKLRKKFQGTPYEQYVQ